MDKKSLPQSSFGISSASGRTFDREMELTDEGFGKLPSNAPLANPYVPFQRNDPARYERGKALIRGTLFPGLDLPYLGMVNTKEKGDSGLAELQALAFAMNELALYLDTHKEDADAAALLQSYSELYQKGVMEYQKRCGTLYQMFAAQDGSYQWVNGPWPWEYAANRRMED